jgi:hypothetical protein
MIVSINTICDRYVSHNRSPVEDWDAPEADEYARIVQEARDLDAAKRRRL